MSHKVFLVLFVLASLCSILSAKNKTPVRFYSSQFAGLTFGNTATVPVVHLNNGIEYRKFTFGIGVAYDAYQLRKVPLYLDLRYTLLKKRVEPILFTYTGTSFMLQRNNYYYWGNGQNEIKRLPGFYNELGVMCKTLIRGNLHYINALSYCISNSRFIQYGEDYWSGGKHFMSPDVLYKVNSNRINFKIGLQF